MCTELGYQEEQQGSCRAGSFPPHLVAADESIGEKRKSQGEHWAKELLCEVFFLISNLLCLVSAYCLFCACSFFQLQVFSSSQVLLTTLGEHGRQRQETSPNVGGHPGGKW